MNKILGIIGGMGPLATAQLYELITLHTKVEREQEHIHILIDSAPDIPDRTNFIKNGGKHPGPAIREAASRLLNAGADHLIMSCNTAHYFKDYVIEIAGNSFIDMIEITARALVKDNIKTIVLMATQGVYIGQVYEKTFNDYGIKIIQPTIPEQEIIMRLIYNIKIGRTDYLREYNELLDHYIKKGFTHFIVGCTELSVANQRFNLHGIQTDPLMCLTKHVIQLYGKTFIE